MTYTVFFKNENGKIFSDSFDTNTRGEARHDFHECYRHGDYIILEVLTNKELKEKYAKFLENSKEDKPCRTTK